MMLGFTIRRALEDNRFVLRISVKDEDVDFGGLRARVWHLQFN